MDITAKWTEYRFYTQEERYICSCAFSGSSKQRRAALRARIRELRKQGSLIVKKRSWIKGLSAKTAIIESEQSFPATY